MGGTVVPRNSILQTGTGGDVTLDTFGSEDEGVAQLDTSNMDSNPVPTPAPILTPTDTASVSAKVHQPSHRVSAIGGGMMNDSINHSHSTPIGPPNKLAMPSIKEKMDPALPPSP